MTKPLFRKSVLTVPLAALALAVSSAYAAPVGPSDSSFYNVPASLPGQPGSLIQYRPTQVNLGTGAPSTQAFNVLYQSTDSLDKPNAVSGTVIVPTTAWSGTGPRPVMIYAIGTHGLASKCAPSRQFEVGKDYEAANMVAALNAGYAVLVSDYAGYLNGQNSTYLSGKSQGQAVLDLFRASAGIPSIGITASSKVGIWGYSQGGQTAAWAGQLLSTYAPEINVVGVAAGGIPGDFFRTAHNLDGDLGAAFLASAVAGLGVQYPNTIGKNFNLLASDEGKAIINKLQTQECVFEALFDLQNKNLSTYTVDPANITLDDLLLVPAVKQTIDAQNLGAVKIPVPLYQFHGTSDEFIPLDQDVALKKAYCAKGTTVAFDVYPGEHITTMTQSAPYVLSWMADRFNGVAAPNTCATTKPDPMPTANPGGGDFVVTLNKWKLNAKVHLRTLMQDVFMPDTSTFSADTNLTTKSITGNVDIPNFTAAVKIIGIPFPTGMNVVPAGNMTGTVNLDNDGILHVHGTQPVNITITSLVGIPMGQCKMVSPVVFPINFDGPIASLGNGGLTFTGSVDFPQIKGCFLSGIFSVLVSGKGQTFNFTVSPPAPVSF